MKIEIVKTLTGKEYEIAIMPNYTGRFEILYLTKTEMRQLIKRLTKVVG